MSAISIPKISGAGRSGGGRGFAGNMNAVAGLALLVFFVFVALAADWLAPGDPLDMVGPALLWPGQDAAFPLGTDSMGRDILAGLVHGARASLAVGVASTAIVLLIGLLVGAVGGYFGGYIDDVLSRLTVIFQTMPTMLLVIVIVAIAGSSIGVIALAIGLGSWPTIARLVRAQFRSLRESDLVMAARSLGYSDTRIIFREILPNAMAPVVVTASVMVATAILIESGLSFLGMGDPNIVSWGMMIADGREMLRTEWFLTALPGAAVSLAVLSLNLLGDGLNDALNPRQST
ncbi:ABC transporter permease [Pollutimonas bauzanensis]|uniref:Peptide/nickel transport system permease protein n=1 Tax=Pollutimonas bauzanensis TaxID=658167 RepID=A0A1M5NKC2_9BURK|nr:peptide/nickel transport system permease protein [Pollutimonas bauzanensis]